MTVLQQMKSIISTEAMLVFYLTSIFTGSKQSSFLDLGNLKSTNLRRAPNGTEISKLGNLGASDWVSRILFYLHSLFEPQAWSFNSELRNKMHSEQLQSYLADQSGLKRLLWLHTRTIGNDRHKTLLPSAAFSLFDDVNVPIISNLHSKLQRRRKRRRLRKRQRLNLTQIQSQIQSLAQIHVHIHDPFVMCD